MGIGWALNIALFAEELLFIAYLSTIFVASQGIGIFLLLVVLSKKVCSLIFMLTQLHCLLLVSIQYIETDSINPPYYDSVTAQPTYLRMEISAIGNICERAILMD